MEWLTKLTVWLISLIKAIWSDFVDFLNDFWILSIEAVLDALLATIMDIPSPAFMESYSLNSLFANFPPSLLYFLSYLELPQAFALIGMGFTFRMVRKLITLFQW